RSSCACRRTSKVHGVVPVWRHCRAPVDTSSGIPPTVQAYARTTCAAPAWVQAPFPTRRILCPACKCRGAGGDPPTLAVPRPTRSVPRPVCPRSSHHAPPVRLAPTAPASERLRHVHGNDPLSVLFFRDVAQFERCLSQGGALFLGFLGAGRRLLVT